MLIFNSAVDLIVVSLTALLLHCFFILDAVAFTTLNVGFCCLYLLIQDHILFFLVPLFYLHPVSLLIMVNSPPPSQNTVLILHASVVEDFSWIHLDHKPWNDMKDCIR